MNITPDNIIKLEPNEIFVMGTNFGGHHGAGAALTAFKKFGAIYGQGTGLQGQSYGIATKDSNLKVLSLSRIQLQINTFIKFAKDNPQLRFLTTAIGTGLSGYKHSDIAPLFFTKGRLPDNISLPKEFWDYQPKNL